jgi:DNA-binding response OmpR family regulator
VDDEPALRRTLDSALRSLGCDVVTAGDAHVAYNLLHESDIDLVLLDLHLPQMSGDTFFVALTRRWPRLARRIVLMTGDTYAEKDHWPTELLSCPLLIKPFTLEMLRDTILQALAEPPSENQRASNGPA